MVRRNEVLLARLHETYHLGVVSNFTGNLEVCLEELGVMQYFSIVADSGRVGITKPDPRLFQHALNWPGHGAGPVWMVGDNFDSDIRPAAALGMSTAWLAPSGVMARSRESGIPTVRLTTLPELAGVLDS